MEAFLSDYGLVWAGYRASDNTDISTLAELNGDNNKALLLNGPTLESNSSSINNFSQTSSGSVLNPNHANNIQNHRHNKLDINNSIHRNLSGLTSTNTTRTDTNSPTSKPQQITNSPSPSKQPLGGGRSYLSIFLYLFIFEILSFL